MLRFPSILYGKTPYPTNYPPTTYTLQREVVGGRMKAGGLQARCHILSYRPNLWPLNRGVSV